MINYEKLWQFFALPPRGHFFHELFVKTISEKRTFRRTQLEQFLKFDATLAINTSRKASL